MKKSLYNWVVFDPLYNTTNRGEMNTAHYQTHKSKLIKQTSTSLRPKHVNKKSGRHIETRSCLGHTMTSIGIGMAFLVDDKQCVMFDRP